MSIPDCELVPAGRARVLRAALERACHQAFVMLPALEWAIHQAAIRPPALECSNQSAPACHQASILRRRSAAMESSSQLAVLRGRGREAKAEKRCV